jgi:hypothetical protein
LRVMRTVSERKHSPLPVSRLRIHTVPNVLQTVGVMLAIDSSDSRYTNICTILQFLGENSEDIVRINTTGSRT